MVRMSRRTAFPRAGGTALSYRSVALDAIIARSITAMTARAAAGNLRGSSTDGAPRPTDPDHGRGFDGLHQLDAELITGVDRAKGARGVTLLIGISLLGSGVPGPAGAPTPVGR